VRQVSTAPEADQILRLDLDAAIGAAQACHILALICGETAQGKGTAVSGSPQRAVRRCPFGILSRLKAEDSSYSRAVRRTSSRGSRFTGPAYRKPPRECRGTGEVGEAPCRNTSTIATTIGAFRGGDPEIPAVIVPASPRSAAATATRRCWRSAREPGSPADAHRRRTRARLRSRRKVARKAVPGLVLLGGRCATADNPSEG